jgi:hypothetical protein
MTSISRSIPPGGIIVDPSKGRSFPDAKPVSYGPAPVWDDPAQENQPPPGFVPENRPDNVWGKINLPSGEIVTIYNGGGTETDHMMLDIDWELDTEAERAQAILAKYGGVLKLEEPPAKPPEVGSDVAAFWSNVMGSDALTDHLLSAPSDRLVPEEWLTEQV